MNPPRYSPTDTDLTDPDNVVQARFEFDRCETVPDFATWAMKWGRNAVAALGQPNARQAEIISELTGEVERLEAVEEKFVALDTAVNTALDGLSEIKSDLQKAINL